jgi:photosystem II stability/assembly factor-like uncharacterized protein
MSTHIIRLVWGSVTASFGWLLLLVWLSVTTEIAAQNFWQQTNGPYGGDIRSLAIAPNGHIFVGTEVGGIFRSTDNGGSWRQVNIALISTSVYALAINSSGHIFAGTFDGRIFRSTDNGTTWTSHSFSNMAVFSLAINSNGHIIAGTNSGVYLSTDNGANWRYSGVVGANVRSLTINSSGHIFAGTDRSGVYRSVDNGNNWKQINKGLTSTDIRSLAADSNGHVFAGALGSRVFRSMDNGENWTQVYSSQGNPFALVINASGHIFAGTYGGGVFRSIDKGGSWTPINIGLTNTTIQSLAINHNEHIFAGTYGGGLFQSTDNGDNWAPSNTGLMNSSIASLAFGSSGQVFAGTGAGVFRSTNKGGNWAQINTGLTNLRARSLVVNARGDIFVGTYGGGVYRSTENSNSWTAANNGLTTPNVNVLALNEDGHIFAGTYEGGIFRSTDTGTTWTNVLPGATSVNIVSFAITSDGDIFAGIVGTGILRSTDNGSSWTRVNNGLTNVNVYAFAINSSGDIFAGTWGSGVFLSKDNGETWKRVNNGLINFNVFALEINSSGHVLAGTSGGGIFLSTDDGDSWTAVNAGLTTPYVIALGINSSGQLFAGTNGSGVFLSERLSRNNSSVAHTTVVQQEAGKEISIKAKINDNLGIARATLYYRMGGETKFSYASLAFTKNDSFQAVIPPNAVTSRGVEYYIVATASDSLTSPWPPSGYFSVRVRVNGEMKKDKGAPIPQPSGSDRNAYRLFSVPLDLDDKNPEAVLDELGARNIKKWRFFELRDDYLKLPADTSKYNEFPNTSEMRPGKSFWLIVKDSSKVIDTGAGLSNLTDKVYPISLHPGWNFVGNPFNFRIPQTNLRLKSKGGPPVLRSYSSAWNDTANSLIGGILPFEGYAVFSDTTGTADTLWVDPDLSFSASSFAKLTAGQRAKPLWSIRIRAQCQEARDVDNIAAVASNASGFSDPNDLPEPPVIGEYVSVYFPHPEWNKLSKIYCTDFRPESPDGYAWLFEVKSNIRDKVNLTFEGIDEVPPELEVWLLDDALSITQNLREQWQYAVAGAGADHPKRLKLVVGKRDFVDGKRAGLPVIPTAFELSQNFPNPFNPVTTIRYGLPQAGRVTLKLYNLLGEEVVILVNDELKAAGYHAAIWDGTNGMGRQVASGVYFAHLRAERSAAGSTQVFMRMKKMLFIE